MLDLYSSAVVALINRNISNKFIRKLLRVAPSWNGSVEEWVSEREHLPLIHVALECHLGFSGKDGQTYPDLLLDHHRMSFGESLSIGEESLMYGSTPMKFEGYETIACSEDLLVFSRTTHTKRGQMFYNFDIFTTDEDISGDLFEKPLTEGWMDAIHREYLGVIERSLTRSTIMGFKGTIDLGFMKNMIPALSTPWGNEGYNVDEGDMVETSFNLKDWLFLNEDQTVAVIAFDLNTPPTMRPCEFFRFMLRALNEEDIPALCSLLNTDPEYLEFITPVYSTSETIVLVRDFFKDAEIQMGNIIVFHSFGKSPK